MPMQAGKGQEPPQDLLCRNSVIADLGNGICLWDATLCPNISQTLFADCNLTPNPCNGDFCSDPTPVGKAARIEEEGTTTTRTLYSNASEIAVKPLTKAQADAITAKNGWKIAAKSFIKVINDGKRYDFVILKAYKEGRDDQRLGMRLSEEVAEAKEVTSATPLAANKSDNIREIGVFAGDDKQVFHLHLGDAEWVEAP